MNLFGVLFVRNDLAHKLTSEVINHEEIHTAQIKELAYVPFYLLYGLNFVLNMFTADPYRSIIFEREAYENDGNLEYLKTRKKFATFSKKYIDLAGLAFKSVLMGGITAAVIYIISIL